MPHRVNSNDMPNNRREFIKLAGLTGIGLTGGGMIEGLAAEHGSLNELNSGLKNNQNVSIIGQYVEWANSLNGNKLPAFSYRKDGWQDIESWRKAARSRASEHLAIPDIGGMPKLTVKKKHEYDGLYIEHLSWQLPYGRATDAILLKPANAKGKLHGVLGFHDHGGNKYFGHQKITRLLPNANASGTKTT